MYGFFPEMPVQDVNKISMLGLAHVGDAVYELLYRSKLCTDGHTAVAEMHRMTVAFVRAEAQAEAAAKLLPVLTTEEASVYKRGRNAKVNSVPHNADIGQYHAATGLEALFGWLYLLGRTERINELFNIITGGTDNAS
ncbi:MAG: ribonuclease III domain-containing protein [Candidatus Limivicinus sp.]|nr:ribonuclease III [Clostridiales bacterium]MDY4223340.1 ribonuclease III domain-containing protein [Candidatus Limivicinus sp.]MDY5083340.1 ribonuclease III domain-containing protein [Candidatus Limivicinus sp.]